MRSPNLQLTALGHEICVTPLASSAVPPCTFDASCRNLATHRILSRDPVAVHLFCDRHTQAWARDLGIQITSANPSAPAVDEGR